MEIVGGLMVMMSIIGFFLAVIWLIMPFVALNMKGKLDITFDILTGVEKRLSAIEAQLILLQHGQCSAPTAAITKSVAAAAEEDQADDSTLQVMDRINRDQQ